MEEEYECNRRKVCVSCKESKNIMLEFRTNHSHSKCKKCQDIPRIKRRGYEVKNKKPVEIIFGSKKTIYAFED